MQRHKKLRINTNKYEVAFIKLYNELLSLSNNFSKMRLKK